MERTGFLNGKPPDLLIDLLPCDTSTVAGVFWMTHKAAVVI
jgi:hypothetical protein